MRDGFVSGAHWGEVRETELQHRDVLHGEPNLEIFQNFAPCHGRSYDMMTGHIVYAHAMRWLVSLGNPFRRRANRPARATFEGFVEAMTNRTHFQRHCGPGGCCRCTGRVGLVGRIAKYGRGNGSRVRVSTTVLDAKLTKRDARARGNVGRDNGELWS